MEQISELPACCGAGEVHVVWSRANARSRAFNFTLPEQAHFSPYKLQDSWWVYFCIKFSISLKVEKPKNGVGTELGQICLWAGARGIFLVYTYSVDNTVWSCPVHLRQFMSLIIEKYTLQTSCSD